MRHRRFLLALVILGLVALGCGLPSFLSQAPEEPATAVKTMRPTFTATPLFTSTLTPLPTAVPSDTPLPTDTAVPPTETPPPPTNTPEPPTATQQVPTATETATPVPPTATRRPAQPTRVPPTNTPVPQARHVVGSHGVSGLVVARDKTTFAVGEKAFFTYEALNHTQDPVNFEKLGIKASNGQFNTSWVNPDVILPDVPFKHDDGLTFNTPGTYKVMLAICFARCGEADADWEEFPQGAATITVR
jgi:hypothetical protein